MKIRTIAFGCAATVAGSMFFGTLPAFAGQNYYNTNPTASERAQTDALNAEAAVRARGDGGSDQDYRGAVARYRHDRRANDAERDAHDLDRHRYNNRDRADYYGDGRLNGAYYDRNGPVAVSFDFNNVAIAYQDGYWDSGRQWHRWSNDAEVRAYRRHRRNHYHDWHHDRDGNAGWPGY